MCVLPLETNRTPTHTPHNNNPDVGLADTEEAEADEEVDYQRVPLMPALDAGAEPQAAAAALASDERDEPLAEAWAADKEGLQALWRPRVRVEGHHHQHWPNAAAAASANGSAMPEEVRFDCMCVSLQIFPSPFT